MRKEERSTEGDGKRWSCDRREKEEKGEERRGEEDWRRTRAYEAKSTGEEEERMRRETTLKIQSGIELGCSVMLSRLLCIEKR